ncbi:hypothetical protein HID58_066445 [Brassica napus]|uniref:RNA helicase n=1 Tax=Brassica napus TaxID=3708 RepID=A0ABQ7ZG74_BRANA|nr:hypothetical protein HID58_066445 [Brassica napus]
MGMNDKVLRGVKKPSEIQQRAVMPILKGRDVIAQAQSGTGKTSMIAISVCQIGNTSSRKYDSGFGLVSIKGTGFTNREDDTPILRHMPASKLEHGVHAVSGTPGRVVYDMIKRGSLRTKSVKLLILDESDEMLSKGLKDQIYDILEMKKKFMTDPVRILVQRDDLTLELSVDWLTEKMRSSNFIVSSMHGDKRQKERDEIMNQFRSFKSRVLIASDEWARGIDVQTVSHVINYDIPNNPELYIHRTGRAGHGLARKTLRDIERYYGTRIREMPADLG